MKLTACPPKQQLLLLPAKLCGTAEAGPPAALAQEIAEQFEFFRNLPRSSNSASSRIEANPQGVLQRMPWPPAPRCRQCVG